MAVNVDLQALRKRRSLEAGSHGRVKQAVPTDIGEGRFSRSSAKIMSKVGVKNPWLRYELHSAVSSGRGHVSCYIIEL